MTAFSFSRNLRILTPGCFKKVFDKADLKVSDQHILLLARTNQLKHPRLGFVFSKKNIRLAVQRNRVRRIMRESFRLNQHLLPGVDIVVLARSGLGEVSSEDLHKLSAKCWSRLIKKAKQQNISD